jgi:hypothetical protein
VVVAAILAWSSGCGGDDSASLEEESASGRSESVDSSPLIAAVEASLAAESYVMTVSGEIPEGAEAQTSVGVLVLTEGESIYQAPDRVLVLTEGETGRVTELYVLGEDMLLSDFPPGTGRPGRYARFDTPDGYIANNVQAQLRVLLDAEVVDVDGDTYEFRIDDWHGRAVIADGFVHEVTFQLTFEGRPTAITYAFARYGSAPAVEPPDRSLIDEGVTNCDEEAPSEGPVFCPEPETGFEAELTPYTLLGDLP